MKKALVVMCGCGTAGYWIVHALVQSKVIAGLERIILCDRAVIREKNRLSCPGYKTHGQSKSLRLAELGRRWSETDLVFEAFEGYAEELPWDHILRSDEDSIFVLVGLDNWSSRLGVTEDLRVVQPQRDVPLIQVGLDRGQGSVAVFGSAWCDPCPACGLPSSLPEPEPCIAFGPGKQLLRGNLHREAQAAADFVRGIIEESFTPQGLARWLNTKTNIVLTEPHGEHMDLFTRSCRKTAGCNGPHGPAVTVRWNEILESAVDKRII